MPKKPEESQPVIAPTVLVGRGIHSDGECYDPGHYNSHEGNQNRQPHPVADNLADRQLVFKRITEVALKHADDPVKVAHDRRLIEAIFGAERFELIEVDAFALRSHFCCVAFEIVSRRQFNDRENQC